MPFLGKLTTVDLGTLTTNHRDLKRAITGIVAASLTLGTMAPAAFAATASTTQYFSGHVTLGSYSAGVTGVVANDAGNQTGFFPFYYVNQALTAAGYTVAWDGANGKLSITTPSGVTPDFSNLNPGSGKAGIYINGTLVQNAPFVVAKDLGGKGATTSFMPIYYINQALARVGITNTYNAGNWTLTPAPVAPAVKAVKGLSATQAEVDFNTAVDSTDGINPARYTINGTSPASVSLSTDGKTATLTFASASSLQVTNGAFVVNPVVTAANSQVSTTRYVQLFTFSDTTPASVTSVTSATNSTTASSATVNFNEPILSLGTVKIDGVVAVPTFTPGATSATFNGLSLDASTSHTVQIIGLNDEASNVSNPTFTFSVTKDTTAPTATLSQQDDHTILVTFNKQMNPTTVTNALSVAGNVVKDETLGNTITYTAAAAVSGSNNTQFTIGISSALYGTSSTRNLTVVLPSGMTDYLGNAFAATTAKVTLTKDTVAPSITGVTYKTDPTTGKVTDIKVGVSKGLPAAAVTPSNSNLVISDTNGILYSTIAPAPSGEALFVAGGIGPKTPTLGDKSIDFSITPTTLTGKYTFSFASGFVSDTAQTANPSTAASFTVDFGAATTGSFPVAGVDSTTTPDTLVVDFGTAVKGGAVTGSATNAAAYSLNGSALPTGTTIWLSADQHKATITLPAGSIKTTDTGAVFTVNGVQDLAGDSVKSYTNTVNVYDNYQPTLNFATLNSDRTVTFGFDEALTVAPAAGDIVVQVNGATLPVSALVPSAGTGLNAGKYVLDLSTLVKYDSTNGTWLDMAGTGTYAAGDIILAPASAGDVHSTINLATSPAITSFKVGTKSTALTAADGTNTAATGVWVTVK